MEVQRIVVGCGNGESWNDCLTSTFSLSFVHNFHHEKTTCLAFGLSSDDLQSSIETHDEVVAGDIFATRSGTGIEADPYVYLVYFHGASVIGDISLISSRDSDCTTPSKLDISISSTIEGGFVEKQVVYQSLDSGTFENRDNSCLDWNPTSSQLEAELNDMPAISDELLPFTITVSSPGTSLTADIDDVETYLSVSDSIRLGSSGDENVITAISGSTITVTDSEAANTYTSYKVHSDSVQVRKSGFNNPQKKMVALRITSDAAITEDTNSETHYKLRFTDNDGTQADSSCIPYHATSDELEDALDSLSNTLDFNRDSLQNDEDHFQVTREGDGSYLWGYGYVYTITFTGDQYDGGRSSVLGQAAPELSVIDVGVNDCTDVTGGDSILSIETLVQGESSYSYDIYFTGSHLSNVDEVSLSPCSDYRHEDGMVHSMEVVTTQDGGSAEIQTLTLSSTSAVSSNSTNGYFALRLGDLFILDSSDICFDWSSSLTSTVLETQIGEAVADSFELGSDTDQVTISRRGSMTSNDGYGYVFTIEFDGSATKGNIPELQVLKDTDSFSVFKNQSYNGSSLDDITFGGAISTAHSMIVLSVTISGSGTPDTFTWSADLTDSSTGAVTTQTGSDSITGSNTAIDIVSGLTVSFNETTGHTTSDVFEVVVLNYVADCLALPSGADVTSSTERNGNDQVKEVTVSDGYQGDKIGEDDTMYLLSELHTILDDGIEIQEIIISDSSGDGVWNNVSPEYTLSYSGTESSCLDWNSEDYEIETALNTVLSSICSSGDCVTVTRSEDAVNAPNGYVYSIYFKDSSLGNVDQLTYTTPGSGCSNAFDTGDDESVAISTIETGSSNGQFSDSTLYLASYDDSSTAAGYLGPDQEGLSIYRANGLSWTVNFESNIGNLNQLGYSKGTLNTDSNLDVIDDVTQGVHTLSRDIPNLYTGIQYDISVRSHTSVGFSSSSSTSSNTPADIPESFLNLQANVALHVDEVQQVILASTHIPEVQTISSSASNINEIQEVTLSAAEGTDVTGKFALKFPEIQVVKTSSGSTITDGGFIIQFSGYDVSSFANGDFSIDIENTTCIDYNADYDAVESALEDLQLIDDVIVTRSGSATSGSDFGYEYSITFVGNEVTGDLIEVGTFQCNGGLTSATADGSVSARTVNDDEAFGTDSEIQFLQVSASSVIHQGQYTLSLEHAGGVETTSCIEWDASADDLEDALEALTNVDSVTIVREGDSSKSSLYGYSYSIVFNGNAMHNRQSVSNIPLNLTSDLTDASCELFSTFIDGELTNFTATASMRATVNATMIHETNIDLDATDDLTSTYLSHRVTLLPTVTSVSSTVVSLPDNQEGRTWTLAFSDDLGDVPHMVCSVDSNFPTNGDCSTNTVMDGNEIGGLWYVETTPLIDYDISASNLEGLLEDLDDIGDVTVTRSGPDSQRGYVWTITFIEYEGDVPLLRTSSSLTGAGVNLVAEEITEGNYMGGSFQLVFDGYSTDLLDFDSSASVIETALEEIEIVGEVDVSETSVDRDGGRTYLVTFRSLPGDVSTIEGDNSMLSGVGSSITTVETIKGSEAVGTSLSLSFELPYSCSISQVQSGRCGSPIDYLNIEVDESSLFGSVSQTLTYTPSMSIQKIRTASDTQTAISDATSPLVSGFFSLSYEGEETNILSGSASSYDIKQALESISSIDTVIVSRDWSFEDLEGCYVDVMESELYVTLSSDSESCIDQLTVGDRLFLDNTWYTVYSLSDSTFQIDLAQSSDSSIRQSYVGLDTTSLQMKIWSAGYEWAITFVSPQVPSELIQSSAHGLTPDDSVIEIRSEDCTNCIYVDSLSVWDDYYLRGRYHNDYGYGEYGSSVLSTPKRIPGVPTDATLEVVSASELEVFFASPSLPDDPDDIDMFTIQWDTTDEFTNATSTSATCSSVDYGHCNITGNSITGTPPYSYLIDGLTTSQTYYVRVAARNSIDPQQVDPSGSPPDNTNWSGSLTATPSDQLPSAPSSVMGSVSGPNEILLQIQPPTRDGGQSIYGYFVEWDSSDNFDSSSSYYGSQLVNITELVKLYTDGPYVHEVSSLISGISYYVRVSGKTTLGTGSSIQMSSQATPTQSPDAPSSLSISSLSESSNPITEIDVEWVEPEDDGGLDITSYKVEWWTNDEIFEVQEVRLSFDSHPSGLTTAERKFVLSYGPDSTVSALSTAPTYYTTSAENLRDRLINIGFTEGTQTIGDIEVSKVVSDGELTYSWFVTFKDSSVNNGDQVSLVAELESTSTEEASIDVIEVTSGVRSGGYTETQLITIEDDSAGSIEDGWFRLSFEGSNYTNYLSSNCTANEMERAIERLDTTNQVEVTKGSSSVSSSTWTITFLNQVGDLISLYPDDTYLSSDTTITVYDGDNSLDSITNMKVSKAMIGEIPSSYGVLTFDSSSRSTTISDLMPGQTYVVSVSAMNSRGYSPRLLASSTLTLPQQEAQPPQNVAVGVSNGNSDQLEVSYEGPSSDGGSTVTKYRVELDITDDFANPIVEEIACPSNNLRTVYKVTVESSSTSNYVYDGYFTLDLDVNGYTYNLDPMAYDIVPTVEDEIGLLEQAPFTVDVVGGQVTVTGTNNFIFPGARIQFPNQLNESLFYTVNETTFTSSQFDLDADVDFTSGAATTGISVSRLYAGRGVGEASYVHCLETTDDTLCPTSRIQKSGSMEYKLESITDAITDGVVVDRTGPSDTNGFIWRITFLDDSPDNPNDYTLSLNTNNVDEYVPSTNTQTSASVTVELVTDGEVYPSCTGPQTVPTSGGLINGQFYFARAFAINGEGYSLPQTASSAEKPQVVPGTPTSVILEVSSSTELRVQWNAPDDNGGDTITEYTIEYDTSSDFLTASSVSFTAVSGGSPFFKVISGLDQGVDYYVRVSAVNSQGTGDSQASTPTYLNPHEEPSAPTNVVLATTSDSMITASFFAPESDGGDDVTSYRIEWDTVSTFNSLSTSPHKGTEDVDATLHNSYTIQYLSESTKYYVQVAAINSAGVGTFMQASPTYVYSGQQVPGIPHTVTVSAGSSVGDVSVSWQRPRIPHHTIPCSGTLTNPDDCPDNLGGDESSSDGGSTIIEYEVEYNERSDFTGSDGGSMTTTYTTATLQGLTSGRTYYYRVLARNAIGSGAFCPNSGADSCAGDALSLAAP